MKKLFLLLLAVIAIGISASAQTRTVRGTVVDENNEALAGVSVVPAGTNSGTSTDFDGNFTLTVGPNVKEITFSYVGYQPVTLPVRDKMNVTLNPTNELLNTLVVTGYGSARKMSSVVGSVAVVGEATFENVPTPTFIDALQGQVAGLNIFSNSGDPSSTDNTINVRGQNSINMSNTPLYILDGAPISSALFTTLNPSDIESVTVLKDAASMAIYGSRAANGVIVITSKRGRYEEQANVNIRATVGWSNAVQDNVTMMNSAQLIDLCGKADYALNPGAIAAWEQYGISTDWVKETFDGHAPTYNLEGTVSGGGEKMNYYISLSHMKQEGIIAQSGMRRETLRSSINGRVNNWFRTGLQLNLGYTDYQTNNEAGASGVYTTNPMVFARKAFPMDSPYYYTVETREDGSEYLNYGEKAMYMRWSGQWSPDWVNGNRSVKRNRLTINGSLYEEVTPITGLVLRAQQSVDAYEVRLNNLGFPKDAYYYTPWGTRISTGTANANGIVEGYNQQSFTRYYGFTYTNTAEYSFNVADKHDISVLVGEESRIEKSNAFGVFSSGQSDIRQMLLTQGTTVTTDDLSQSIVQETANSVFGQAHYSFDDRYFFSATVRHDGSSLFAPGNRWATFYSVGGMWNAKNEKFLQPLTWLNDLRVRVSYGTTGNTSIGNYAYFGLVGAYTNPYAGVSGLGIAQASNPDLTWETVRNFDFGVSFRLWDRISMEVDAYRKETVNMLMDIPYSFTTGFSSGSGNMGSMKNVGVDVDFRADIFKNRDWYVGARVNFNYNKNRITELIDGQDTYTLANYGLQYKVGHAYGEFYQVRYAGVDPQDGAPMWYDVNGNITKNYNEERDAVLIGKNRYAPWTGGFGVDARWKGLSLRVDFNWAAKKYMINNDRYFMENPYFIGQFNQMDTMENMWTTPGQITDIPGAAYSIQFDDHLVENASFLRMKTLGINYQFPKSITSKLGLNGLALNFTGRNLLTFTKFSGYDPEPGMNLVSFNYPNTRQYEFGIEVNF